MIQQLRDEGELDNTLVIYIQGDNGASLEDFHGSNQELNVIAGLEASDAELRYRMQGAAFMGAFFRGRLALL